MKPPRLKDYPKTIKLGDEVYTLRFVRKFEDRDQVGECDAENKEIILKLGEGREETFKTYIHEIIHGLIEFEGDVELKHRLVYKVENFIYQFFVDNF